MFVTHDESYKQWAAVKTADFEMITPPQMCPLDEKVFCETKRIDTMYGELITEDSNPSMTRDSILTSSLPHNTLIAP